MDDSVFLFGSANYAFARIEGMTSLADRSTGSAKSLEQAVQMMGRHQLGLELERDEVLSIVAWLKSLTGTIPATYIKKPELPPSGPTTPKPDTR